MLGAGTQDDPFLITTPAEFLESWNGNYNKYKRLTTDIDMAGAGTLKRIPYPNNMLLDGAGHKVTNITAETEVGRGGTGCYIENIELHVVSGFTSSSSCQFRWTNVHLKMESALTFGYRSHYQSSFINILVSGNATCSGLTGASGNNPSGTVTNQFIACAATPEAMASSRYNVLEPADRTRAAAYADLPDDKWVKEDGFLPHLKEAEYDYSQFTYVKGVTTVDGSPEKRSVRIVDEKYHGLLGATITDDEGKFELNTEPLTRSVIVIAYDSIGEPLATEKAYAIDDIVHPPTSNGYRYVCIQAGTSAATAPGDTWPTDQLETGTAIFKAKKVRPPSIQAPVIPARRIP